ncbi:hypothetical protein GF351_02330 [Candidatus Woesearchaeota archaeon]|nr:hypothetical protein [Candidatus Woesearchaeota archaeon]
MKKNSPLQLTAVFMALLVMTIPFYTTDVYAQLSQTRAYGADQVDGYLRSREDTLYVTTFAQVSGDANISRNQVRLSGSSSTTGFQFKECAEGFCTFFQNLSAWSLSYPSHSMGVYLYSDAGAKVDDEIMTVTFDEQAPEVDSFSADPSRLGSGMDTILRYTVSDELPCSGIGFVEIYEQDTTSEPERVNLNTEDCEYSGEYTLDLSGYSEGEHTVFLKVYDRLGRQSSFEPAVFEIDLTPPQFTDAVVLDSEGEELIWISSDPVPATVRVDIAGDDLDESTVYADLSSIHEGMYLSEPPARCTSLINFTMCEWDVEVDIDSTTTPLFAVTASDLAANNASDTVSASTISMDVTGPEFTSIRTEKVLNTTSYLKASGNTLIAALAETGVGVDPEDVFLDLRGIGMGAAVAADNCSGNTCYWHDVYTNRPDGAVTISSSTLTRDRLGNPATVVYSTDMLVDITPPRLDSLDVTTIGGEEETFEGFTKKGDSYQIVAEVYEPTSLTAYGDFSAAITGASQVEPQYEETGNEYTLTWDTDPIDVSGYFEDYLDFTFTDFVGNTLDYMEYIEVYALDDDENPNYWTHSVVCSPKLVDRQITSLLNVKVFCYINLQPLAADAETISIDMGECTGVDINISAEDSNQTAGTDSMSYINDISLWNNQAGSTDPYLNIELKTADFRIDELRFNCPLSIMSRVGDTLPQYPETEDVEVTIGFYNMPLGELSEDVQAKIDDAKDDATSTVMEIIGLLEKLFYYAELICRVINVIHNVITIFQSVTMMVGKAEKVSSSVPPAYAKVHETRVLLCQGTEKAREGGKRAYKFGTKFCAFVNCKMGAYPPEEQKKGLAKWGNTLGGGGGIYNWMQESYPGVNVIDKWTGKSPAEYMNIKDSMVLSMLTFCIPGVIYNLNKYRQVQCLYAYCLQEYSQAGLPLSVCEDQKHYLTCKYIMGEVFNLIPFVAIFDHYTGLIKEALSDPFSMIGTGLGLLCNNYCEAPYEDLHSACAIVKIASLLGETVGDVINIIDTWELDRDYCELLDDDEGEDEGDWFGGIF